MDKYLVGQICPVHPERFKPGKFKSCETFSYGLKVDQIQKFKFILYCKILDKGEFSL